MQLQATLSTWTGNCASRCQSQSLETLLVSYLPSVPRSGGHKAKEYRQVPGRVVTVYMWAGALAYTVQYRCVKEHMFPAPTCLCCGCNLYVCTLITVSLRILAVYLQVPAQMFIFLYVCICTCSRLCSFTSLQFYLYVLYMSINKSASSS